MSNSQWVRYLYNCHQWNPSQAWTALLTWDRYLPASSNHKISNLRGGHKTPQPKAAKPDLWDGAMLGPLRDARNVSWECWVISVGTLRSQFILRVQFYSERQWSLPLQYKVWWTQGDEPPRWHTSNLKIWIQGIWVNYNEHFPVCFIFLLLKRHWGTWDRESVDLPAKTQTGTEPPGLMQEPLYTMIDLGK